MKKNFYKVCDRYRFYKEQIANVACDVLIKRQEERKSRDYLDNRLFRKPDYS